MTNTDGHVRDAGHSATALYEVVVVAYRSRRPLTQLLASLPADIPLTLVDNSADQDPVRDLLEGRSAGTYIDAGGNVGFAAAANLGARTSTRPYVIFVNPDCTPTLDALDQLVDYLERHPRCASAAPALMDRRSKPQIGAAGWQPTLRRALVHAIGLHLWWPHKGIWGRARPGEVLEVGWLPGTCLTVRQEAFLQVGGFDERYFLYSEDMALGARLQACGHTQVLRGDLRVTHTGGGSSEV
ncbi:MAG: glycosyltransferase, partial [Pseudonocardiaceae bacterium]